VLVVEIHEEAPVQQPRARVELEDRARRGGGRDSGRTRGGRDERGRARVDRIAERVYLLECGRELAAENVRGELAPVGGGKEVGVGGEDAEVVEVVGGSGIVAACELELAKVVQSVDLFECELVEG
jgi:hypothetical protein